MTMVHRYPVWRYQIVDLRMPIGAAHRRIHIARGPEFGPSADWYSYPLDLDDFSTGPSEYELASDEVYCPCGATLPEWDGTAGHLLRLISDHCHKAGHPTPKIEGWGW